MRNRQRSRRLYNRLTPEEFAREDIDLPRANEKVFCADCGAGEIIGRLRARSNMIGAYPPCHCGSHKWLWQNEVPPPEDPRIALMLAAARA